MAADAALPLISSDEFADLVERTKLSPAAVAFALLQVNGTRASTIAAVEAARRAQLSGGSE